MMQHFNTSTSLMAHHAGQYTLAGTRETFIHSHVVFLFNTTSLVPVSISAWVFC